MNPIPPRDNPSSARTIENAAARWVSAQDSGLTPRQEADLAAWLAADPRHAEAFRQLGSTSRALERLKKFRPENDVEPDPDLRLPRRSTQPRGVVYAFRTLGFAGIAAAAVLAVVSVAWLASRPGSLHESVVTEVGGRKSMTLPDGSSINVNTDSALAVAYTADARRIDLLRGEAHFSVTRDAARPFIVRIGSVSVTAVGTAFSVRLHPQAVEILVTEGKVGLSAAREDAPNHPAAGETPAAARIASDELVEAGHRAVIAAPAANGAVSAQTPVVTPVSSTEMSQRLAWQERRLEFGPTPLSDVVAEFNRYSSHRLVVANSETARLSVGGSFQAGDVETLLRLLESHFGIETERGARETILRKRASR